MNLIPADITVGDFADHTHAHLEGYLIFNPVLTRHVLNCARQAHVSVSLDLASFEVVRDNREFIGELLDDYVDIVFANSDESEAFCGSNDPEEGLEALRQHCKTAVVKVGADGAYLAHGSRRAFVPAVEAKALDTTGAGDLWAAGFLWAHLTGHDLNTAGHIGALLGGAVVEVMGARMPGATWQTLTKQIEDVLQ
jgi:sugar/nucleoside kinase (ribokinase family)